MKVDITVQLILFVINLCLCTGAVIFTRGCQIEGTSPQAYIKDEARLR